MDDKYIIAHDMGTSSNKAVLVTVLGDIVADVRIEYPLHHPHPNWAEQNPLDWWRAVCDASRHVLAKTKVKPQQIAGVTFSSQTQSLVAVDRQGAPLRPAMIWLDGRSAEIIRKKLWYPPRVKGFNLFNVLRFLAITGGAPGHTGKDQIGKILWLKYHEPEIFQQTHHFLDAKDFVIRQLTGHSVTSVDLAYIWWMMDSRKQRNRWHPGLTRLAEISSERLPDIQSSASIVGQITDAAARETGLLPGTPVINGAGDLAAAALGSGALNEGEFIACLGTSGWVASHVTRRKADIPHYTGCIGSALPDRFYLAMAHQETCGICLEWLKNKILYHKDQLKKEGQVDTVYQILDQLAHDAGPGAEGLIFTPWMYGERCPIDDDHVRAGLYNIGLNHDRKHLVRAVFEGIAFNTRWAMETLENLYEPVTSLRLIGGGAKSDIWCQIMADITNRAIHRVAEPQQAAARGVALLSSLALGFIDSLSQMKAHISVDRCFYPNPDHRILYDKLFNEFKNIYKHNKSWYKRMHGIYQ